MPQSRLPDINTAFVTYRREVIRALNYYNYSNCVGALYALNALLPKDYRVQISSSKYTEKTQTDVIVFCKECKQEHKRNSIQVYDLKTTLLIQILSQAKSKKVWDCPSCGCENSLAKTEMAQTVLKQPFFLKVVSHPPERQDGLMDRKSYHSEFSKWVWQTLHELEERMAQFRDDNWQKGEESDIEGGDIDVNSGEDQD
jgi:hypothetical protein